MLSIRLSRQGTKKKALYRLMVTEKTRDPWGKYLENLGNYNPHTKVAVIKGDRVKYWLSCGAQASPTVKNLLISQGVIEGQKVRAGKSQPGKKKSAQIALKKVEEEAKKKTEAAVKVETEKAAAEAKAAATPAESAPAPEAAKPETEKTE